MGRGRQGGRLVLAEAHAPTEDHGEEGHAHVHAALHLAEVGGARIVVKVSPEWREEEKAWS